MAEKPSELLNSSDNEDSVAPIKQSQSRNAIYQRNNRKYQLYLKAYPDDTLFSKIGLITDGGLEEPKPSTRKCTLQTFLQNPPPHDGKLDELSEECIVNVMRNNLDTGENSIGTSEGWTSDASNNLENFEPVSSKLKIMVTPDEDKSMDTSCHVTVESISDERSSYVQDSSASTRGNDDVRFTDTSSDSDEEEISESDTEERSETNERFLRRSKDHMNVPFIVKPDVTTHDQLLYIIATAVKHCLTYEATLTMLKTVNSLSVFNGFPTSKTALWKALCRNESIISRHMYCSKCKDFVEKGKACDRECACKACGLDKENKSLSYFVQLSLHSQLGEMLAIPGIAKSLQYRFTRIKKDGDAMEDIFDGDQYEKKGEPGGFLSNAMNFSFIFNTDGCAVSESSKASAWPILLQINELPPHARKRHMLLAGVWVDNVHPPLNTLLYPTVCELQQLYEKGITWKPDGSTEVTSKFVALVCSVDSIARPAILRMTQFNGAFGCTFCYARSQIYPGKYPLEEHSECRTDADMRKHMHQALELKEKVYGVKGPSVLMLLPEFDLALGVIVESMHNVYLGVVKHHMELLLFGKASDEWYFGAPKNLEVIQNRLLKIRNHSQISRKPREISAMKLWKASEWRNWLLYYCLPCLEGVVNESYLNHLTLLCRAAYIFNKDSIKQEEIHESRQLLCDYVEQFEKKFGRRHMYYNIHLLTHLADTVQNWGPFWAHSAFPFEAWNRRIIESVTSPTAKPLQIVSRFLMSRFVYSAQYDLSISDHTREIISQILQDKNVTVHSQAMDLKTTHFSGLGKENERRPHDWEMKALRSAGYECDSLHLLQRAKINSIEYRCTTAKKTRFSNNTVYCCNERIGEIVQIVHFQYNHKQICGVFIEVLQHIENAFGTTHIQNVIRSKDILFVTADKIDAPGLTIQTPNGLRAIKLSNCWETD